MAGSWPEFGRITDIVLPLIYLFFTQFKEDRFFLTPITYCPIYWDFLGGCGEVSHSQGLHHTWVKSSEPRRHPSYHPMWMGRVVCKFLDFLHIWELRQEERCLEPNMCIFQLWSNWSAGLHYYRRGTSHSILPKAILQIWLTSNIGYRTTSYQ